MKTTIKLGIDGKEFTKQCKLNGYSRKTVLKYIIENKYITEKLCEKMIKENDLQNILENAFENREWQDSGVKLDLSCDYTLSDILKQYNIPTSAFIYYLQTKNKIKYICNIIPNDLKLKKYK